jgi:hypothetical protein
VAVAAEIAKEDGAGRILTDIEEIATLGSARTSHGRWEEPA